MKNRLRQKLLRRRRPLCHDQNLRVCFHKDKLQVHYGLDLPLFGLAQRTTFPMLWRIA